MYACSLHPTQGSLRLLDATDEIISLHWRFFSVLMRFPRAQRPDACATLDGGEWAQFLEEQEQAAKWERERIEQQKPRKIRVVPSEFSQERRTTIEGLLTVNVPRGGDDDTFVVLSPILNGHEMTRERQARLRQGERMVMSRSFVCA